VIVVSVAGMDCCVSLSEHIAPTRQQLLYAPQYTSM